MPIVRTSSPTRFFEIWYMRCDLHQHKCICPRIATWKTAITQQGPPVLYRDGDDLSVDAIQFVSSFPLWANRDRCLTTTLWEEANRYSYRDQCIACTAQTAMCLPVENTDRSSLDDPTILLSTATLTGMPSSHRFNPQCLPRQVIVSNILTSASPVEDGMIYNIDAGGVTRPLYYLPHATSLVSFNYLFTCFQYFRENHRPH